MLLDVLTLLGALYVLLTIVEYLCSLLSTSPSAIVGGDRNTKSKKDVREEEESSKKKRKKSEGDEDILCDACGHQHQPIKPKIQYIIMASEIGGEEPELESEILKRRKRLAAGEVKGFYMSGATGQNESIEGDGSAACDRRHSSYGGDPSILDSETGRRKSVSKDAKSCDDPSILQKSGSSQPNIIMVGLSGGKDHPSSEQYYNIDPNNWISGTDTTKPSASSSSSTIAAISHQSNRQQQFHDQQRGNLDERRLSLDTVPVKLSAPVTVIKSASGSVGTSGSPMFKISENSAFTPIQPRREASIERRPPPSSLLSVNHSSLHAQSFPDVSGQGVGGDSGVHTAASVSVASTSSVGSTSGGHHHQQQQPIQITVVMKPTSTSTNTSTLASSGQQQRPSSQKVSSTLFWTSTGGNKDHTATTARSTLDPSDSESKSTTSTTIAAPQSSPVRLKMVQTVTSGSNLGVNLEPQPPPPQSSEPMEKKEPYQPSSKTPDSNIESIKLKLIQPTSDVVETSPKSRKPYAKAATTSGLASTAALARATAAANYKNANYVYSNSSLTQPMDFDTIRGPPNRHRQLTPPPPAPPPPPSAELLTPQLLKKQSPLGETYPKQGGATNQRAFYDHAPQMALTRAMRSSGTAPSMTSVQGQTAAAVPKLFFGSGGSGGVLNENNVPQPYHPPTMATYEHQHQPLPPPSPRTPGGGSDSGRFVFGSGGQSSFETVGGRQPRQQQRASSSRYSPMATAGQQQHGHHGQHEGTPNVLWRTPTSESNGGGGGGAHQHSLSVDEGMGNERSRSRERSRIRRPQQQSSAGYSVDENAQPQAPPSDFYIRASFDDEKLLPPQTREITDQGVPANEDVLKGGNVSSKTKLFEALAEKELDEVDAAQPPVHFYQQPPPPQPPQRRSIAAVPIAATDRWIPPGQSTLGVSVGHPKHKKMERSHTVHTVRSLMAPDAYQYENAPYNPPPPQLQQPLHNNPYSSFQDPQDSMSSEMHHHHHQTPSPRHSYQGPPTVPAFFGQESSRQQEPVVEYPPAAISPRSVQKEHAVIGKGHIQQAQVLQQPVWQPHPPSTPRVHVQVHSSVAPPQQQPSGSLYHHHHHVQPAVSLLLEGENVFEDEMSKMSIADKAKLFELKAEEQSRIKPRRYNATRHKTQPVTTDEVVKARSMLNEMASNQKSMRRTGATDEETDETEDERAGSRASAVSSSRNVIIYQRTPDPRRSASRDVMTMDSQRDPTPSSTTSGGGGASSSVKPRRIVYLHSENGGSTSNLEPEAPPPTLSSKKRPDSISDQNNNEKSEKPSATTESSIKIGEQISAPLVNGSDMKPSAPPRVGSFRRSEPPPPVRAQQPPPPRKESIKDDQQPRIDGESDEATNGTRSIGVREKANMLMNEISKHQAAANRSSFHGSTSTVASGGQHHRVINGHSASNDHQSSPIVRRATTNGHHHQPPSNGHRSNGASSRILVNQDDSSDDNSEEEKKSEQTRTENNSERSNGHSAGDRRTLSNGHHHQRTPDNALDRFFNKDHSESSSGNEATMEIEHDSFMHIVRTPVIRLQHFERPKPNRRHSTCGIRRGLSTSDKNGAIAVNH